MTATYTVYDASDWSAVVAEGLSLEDAADRLLTADGHAYELRSEDGIYVLWVSDGSAAAVRGAGHFRSCAAGGFLGSSEAEVWEKVVGAEWHGLECLPDDLYSARQAEFEGQE